MNNKDFFIELSGERGSIIHMNFDEFSDLVYIIKKGIHNIQNKEDEDTEIHKGYLLCEGYLLREDWLDLKWKIVKPTDKTAGKRYIVKKMH